MQLGLIGLGKMGGNMRDRLRSAGHEVIGFDPRPEVTDVESLAALAAALTGPRVVWVMVPSGEPTRDTVRNLSDVLEAAVLEPHHVLADRRVAARAGARDPIHARRGP